jgi:hypothetical protein
VLAKRITGSPPASFILGDVIPGWAFIVVVIPAFICGLLDLIDGVERQNGHVVVLLNDGTSLAPAQEWIFFRL